MEDSKRQFINFKKGKLHFGALSIDTITKKYSSPFYLYSKSLLENNYLDFKKAAEDSGLRNFIIAFALKANNNIDFLKTLASLGAGADIVSGGELKRALECGIPSQKIVFSGVGKTQDEITLALEKDIYSFNVESLEELEMINQLAKKMDKVPRICFRLNPKVIVNTHKHISTGYKTHKFGLLAEDILQAEALPKYFSHTRLVGLSIHIGSQLTELDATKKAISNMCDCAKALKSSLEFLDVGGGLGVNYKPGQAPSIQTYMKLVFETLKEKDCLDKRIVFEPGRKIAASCGFFVSKVIRSKTSEECHFVIVDGGMNDFVRPSLYDAYHEIYSSTDTEEKITTDIVGPICETADCFGTNRTISKVKPGDYIVICDTGAYGHTMSSTYNMREKPKEFLID